jgi:hypothetical protein
LAGVRLPIAAALPPANNHQQEDAEETAAHQKNIEEHQPEQQQHLPPIKVTFLKYNIMSIRSIYTDIYRENTSRYKYLPARTIKVLPTAGDPAPAHHQQKFGASAAAHALMASAHRRRSSVQEEAEDEWNDEKEEPTVAEAATMVPEPTHNQTQTDSELVGTASGIHLIR